jgi:archaemetzincin
VDCRPVRATKGQVLAFLPLGPFREDEKAVFDRTVELARIWFDLDVRVLPARELGEPDRTHFGRPQHLTVPFLRGILPRARPDDAVCLFGVTMADLYPRASWNYVFGEATFRGQVGIYSFARYFGRFWGEKDDAASRKRALRRACRVVVHEAGHTFGLAHCIRWQCVMNGSNSLDESDRQPLRLCPGCLRKLQWNRGFDVEKRYERLVEFYAKTKLETPGAWVRARLSASGKKVPATAR